MRGSPSSRGRYGRRLRIAGVVAALGLIMPAAAAAPKLPSGAGRGSFRDYIVMLNPSVGDPAGVAEDQTDRPGASVQSVFGALKGYAATFRSQDAEAVRRDPRTRLVAEDGVVTTQDAFTQSPAPFGLDRIDQLRPQLNNSFSANNDGAGVTVYVIDTGIRATHSEFRTESGGSRVLPGANFVNDGRTTDCNGHGTHVAGIVAGNTYGVAQKANLVPVRALNCSGSASISTVINAINWVAANAQRPAVANMSLGGSSNQALDLAVQSAINTAKVPFSIAAGNGSFFGGTNACNTSPARVGTAGAMTIGATDSSDRRASFSNYGNCVDWFAPGVNIPSAWYSSDTATRTLSGTSMAAPYTAGVAALYLDAYPESKDDPAKVNAELLKLSQLSGPATNSRTVAANSGIVTTGRGRTDGGLVL